MGNIKMQFHGNTDGQGVDELLNQSIEKACIAACEAIAPSWPLDRAIAVNPYWKRIQSPLCEVAARMAVLGNISVFPARNYMLDAWNSGRIQKQHLDFALKELFVQQGIKLTYQECINGLNQPLDIDHLPLLIDLLDDDPNRHKRLSWRQAITHQVSQVCATYFDENQAEWRPNRGVGLYDFWRETLTHDHGIGLLMGLPDLAKHLQKLPLSANEAEIWVIQKLGLPESVWASYLEAVLLTVNGWASWCAYLNWQAVLKGEADQNLRELLAIRLAWGLILLEAKDQSSAENAFFRLKNQWAEADDFFEKARQILYIDQVWQRALEVGYQGNLAKALNNHDQFQPFITPDVQAAFCIDVRSERMRRVLETLDPRVHTKGYAGFFGLPIAYSPLGTSLERPQLPGLLPPTMHVREQVQHADKKLAENENLAAISSRHLQFHLSSQWDSVSRWPNSVFSFVEAAGFGYVNKLRQWLNPASKPRVNGDKAGIKSKYRELIRPVLSGVSDEERIALAIKIIKSLSLGNKIAPIVLLVGHASQSANNAHSSSLDCGACCGQSGEVNVRLLASLLNDEKVRKGLEMQALHIPKSTTFVAAIHNTTTDEIEVFDQDFLRPETLNLWNRLMPVFEQAGDLVRRERAAKLNLDEKTGQNELLYAFRQRANDGAQTRPEWGLAGNAAFIIADRARTARLKLDGRVFLHEYNAFEDVDGSLLEQLMTAPMLVTHWINWQYHASSCDPLNMGSGNKLLHNIVGSHIGVFEGNGGDLRIGLSKQSLHDGKAWIHEPLRLTVVIDAPASSIERVISKHSLVQQLVHHGWIHLWRFDELGLMEYHPSGWKSLAL